MAFLQDSENSSKFAMNSWWYSYPSSGLLGMANFGILTFPNPGGWTLGFYSVSTLDSSIFGVDFEVDFRSDDLGVCYADISPSCSDSDGNF